MGKESVMNLAKAFACCAVLAGPTVADETVRFAPPVRIEAGGKLLGAGRYYPSPVLHDANGDGCSDLVVGDLMGHVTVALRMEDGVRAETPLLDRDGQPLRFNNW